MPELLSGEGRAALAGVVLPEVARERVGVALRMIEAIDRELAPLERELAAFARRQPGCRALMGDYGVGALTATAILAELGDARRFRSSRRAVRHSGLDITFVRPPTPEQEGLRDLVRCRDDLRRARTAAPTASRSSCLQPARRIFWPASCLL